MSVKLSYRWPIPDEQQLLAALREGGVKPSKAAERIAHFLPMLTRAELEEFLLWEMIDDLARATPEERHERLSTMDSCPCCDHWLGHNNPPPDTNDPPPPITPRKKKLPLLRQVR